MSPAAHIADLGERIGLCRICRDQPIGEPLPHEPRPVFVLSDTARILIAGQAPGTRVHASGLPFDDASGDRLRGWLGVTREEFYDSARFAIVAMGFCFPGQDANGGDLPPRRECAAHWRDSVMAGMPQIDLILAIGLYAQRWHIGAEVRATSLTENVRAWRRFADPGRTPKIIPLPHPSWRNSGWLKRHSWFEMELLPVLRVEVQRRSQR